MNLKKISQVLKNNAGFEIGTDFFCNSEQSINKIPLIIFCHGFKGFKDWGGFPYMMEQLAFNGFASVSFNFSHNGVSKENPHEFTKPELFSQNTFSQELDDLRIVLNYFYVHAEKYNIDKNSIGLIGHSRGGGIAVIKASEDEKIKALAVLASVSEFDRYSDEQKRKWKEKGYYEVENTRTKQVMRLNYSLMEDMGRNKDRMNITNAISKIKFPLLIIHGKEDLAVKSESANELYKYSNKQNSELQIIENTGHTFGAVHPFKGTTKAFEQVIELLVGFFNSSLKK